MRKNNINIVAFFFLLAIPVIAYGQGARIESPVIHQDRTVTFNFRAPDAKKVELSTQFIKGPQALKKDTSGVWSITLGPVDPDIYPYSFIVDGVSIADPNNAKLFPNERFKNSLVEIPGDKTALYSLQDVPHGTLTYCYYYSKSLKQSRPLVIYTPPSYNKDNNKFPVFYLISGTTDTEETWFRVGRVNNILDNLIAQKKAVPMVVVMPYGNTSSGSSAEPPSPLSIKAADMYKVFNDDLVGSIIPYVEENIRAIPKRESRAIAGFSRGGGQSLFAGFNNIDKFAWICAYSAYLTPEVLDKYLANIYADPTITNKQLKLLWVGVGDEDFLYKPTLTFIDFLKEKKIEQKNLITTGGHTWMNARHYLSETVQMIFK
jgi:enterochelin esterase-like enzyme